MLGNQARFGMDDEGGQPQAGGEASLADLGGQRCDAIWKARREIEPVADLGFEAVVNLDQVEGQGGAQPGGGLQVGADVGGGDFLEVVVPGAPAGE